MSLKQDLRKGVQSSFALSGSSNQTNDEAGAKDLQQTVKKLASELCALKDDSGKDLFTSASGTWPSGAKYMVLHRFDGGAENYAKLSLTMSSNSPETSSQAKLPGRESSNVWTTSTKNDALSFVANWVGQAAPQAQSQLEKILESYDDATPESDPNTTFGVTYPA